MGEYAPGNITEKEMIKLYGVAWARVDLEALQQGFVEGVIAETG
jgi:hypothetical protein